MPPITHLSWAHIILANSLDLNYEKYVSILETEIKPSLALAIEKLTSKPEFQKWLDQYKIVINGVFEHYQRVLEFNRYHEIETLSQDLCNVCPELESTPSITLKSLRILLGDQDSVDTVLLGLRQQLYIYDIIDSKLELKNAKAFEQLLPVLNAFRVKPRVGMYTAEEKEEEKLKRKKTKSGLSAMISSK
eukprot:TRINITY_DN2804_c0_g1_i2.p1 TRINITY_DN2804_c0_g1~~TRINITY_DN2804_c0_g1_i2.p1  ORF type:complete len:190 (+),score=14.71 TRINITY_DN2804_c0_g1_i2:468-1037(+)